MSFNNKLKLDNSKTQDIMLVGEILIDEITSKNSSKSIKYFGGSPANLAANIKNLGFTPYLFGAVGNDEDGDFLLNKLIEKNISISNIEVTKKATSKVQLEETTGTPKPLFKRFSDSEIILKDEMKASVINSKIFHFTYWPLSKEPSRSTIYSLIECAKNNNVITGFDPNYHIDLEGHESVSINDLKLIMANVDIIKPSLDDSARIFGEGFSKEYYLNKFQELGCKLIVMTLGKDGLIVSYKNETLEMPSLANEVVDSTGAGDAFWSGLYAGILNNETILNSIKIGLAASALNLEKVGSETNIFSLNDIKKKFNLEE